MKGSTGLLRLEDVAPPFQTTPPTAPRVGCRGWGGLKWGATSSNLSNPVEKK